MFDCPNCGEPVEDGASFCPHCGSDAETGWRPDVDYYSLELPEGENEHDREPEPRELPPDDTAVRLRNILGPGALVLFFVLFVSVGLTKYDLLIIPPAVFLVAMALIFLLLPGGNDAARREDPRPQ